MRTVLLLWILVSPGICDRSAGGEAAAVEPIRVAEADWPWWRGPHRNGVAAPDQQLPESWSENENVIWKTPVPGRGHGSPTVVGSRVFLATAEEASGTQSVLCFDRRTGKTLWSKVVHEQAVQEGNKKASLASSTVACDRRRIFINFLNGGAVFTSALSLDGKLLWQTKISDYVVHQGYGSSPALYGPLVLVSADNKGGGAIAALKRDSGEIVWRHKRPETPNYASPILVDAAGRQQLVLIGCDRVSSFDPLTGKALWQCEGATTECVTSTVTDGKRIFTSGGYPRNHVSAVRADGSGTVDWANNVRVYVPSMLVNDGYLYAVTDAGVATCWEATTGKQLWQGRLGGTMSSSPVLVGDRILVANEGGEMFLFRAQPESFELVAQHTLGDEVFATPVVCGNRIYHRVAHHRHGRRQEMLYCIGQR